MKAFLEKINQELDQARSFLARHGGDIEVVAFDEKTGV
jgi:Fe-S cluster biogenesis protein NfuA